uniref:Uncharacterized protein n=1 Tax=Rhizophora mucronata TaxID=61149 RepID=A0A2P2QC28_RHIMU
MGIGKRKVAFDCDTN